jgi:hypothetical protein
MMDNLMENMFKRPFGYFLWKREVFFNRQIIGNFRNFIKRTDNLYHIYIQYSVLFIIKYIIKKFGGEIETVFPR